ncbi:protein lin-52 homolog isoform X2 [Meles meles]|uniref:protein lin-52 homolog isoform X2 n=1 Tax=Meles meles TaxID=9662 RepID=UPI001E6985B9|nr:protein lin-52 homolog isoform X2 [Meles meles]
MRVQRKMGIEHFSVVVYLSHTLLLLLYMLFPKGTDLEASLLSFEKLDRASPDLWPEQLPGVAEFAASFKSPITSSPPKWMAEIERDDIDMLKELGSLTTANLMEKVRGLQNLAYQLGLDELDIQVVSSVSPKELMLQ